MSKTSIYVDMPDRYDLMRPVAVFESNVQGERSVEFDSKGNLIKATENSRSTSLMRDIITNAAPSLEVK